MVRIALRSAFVVLALVAPCFADEPKPMPPTPAPEAATEITWTNGLPAAFEAAKKQSKPVLIAINAAFVDGGKAEPAGRELRDNTYRDAAVVARSLEFVCAMVKPDGTSTDYAELRTRYGMQGDVVSPQHIFAYSDGTLIGQRHEYWTHGTGAAAVSALLSLMDSALAAHRSRVATPSVSAPDAAGADAAEKRAAWIRDQLVLVRKGSADAPARDGAIATLVKGDQKGDCIEPLGQVLLDSKKDAPTQVAIVRAFGKPGLELAVASVVLVLDASNDVVRSNAAVTLEYIGSPRAIEPLTKRLPHERDEVIVNNLCRALGRCGVHAEAKKDGRAEAVRKILAKELGEAKSDKGTVGPAVGLAYFEKDADAARALEKLAKKDANTRRTFCLWALTEIRDEKSAANVKEIVRNDSRWYMVRFNNAVLLVLTGEDTDGTAKGAVETGMAFGLGAVRGSVGGDARRDRDQTEWKPKGEIVPQTWGGGRNGGMPGGMDDGGGMGG